MADQWMGMLKDIPPGTDIFDFVKGMLTDQMFPKFGTAYWSFLYLAIGLLSFTLVSIIAGFYLRIKRRGLSWTIVQDGACTHISPKAWVPLFWGIMSALLIGQIAWTYRTLHEKVYTGAFSAYSVVTGAIPIMSFSCLTLHVWTSAPPFRRFLIRFGATSTGASASIVTNRSVILINFSLLLWCVLAGIVVALPGRNAYKQGVMAGATYDAALRIIDRAKSTGNLGELAGLTATLGNADTMEAMRCRTNDLTGYIFSPFFIFYLFGAIFPAVFLNIYIRNRIKDYDLDLSMSQDAAATTSRIPRFDGDLPLSPASLSKPSQEPTESEACQITIHLPTKLPKDRPFANIIEVNHTTAAPRHLQRIMDERGAKPAEKSARLRAALRRDNQMLFAYCLLLSGMFGPRNFPLIESLVEMVVNSAMGSIAFYMLTGASNRVSASDSLRINLMWEVYSFVIPASMMSCLFLYDAIRNGNAREDDIINAPVTHPYSRHKVAHSLPHVITLSQQVTVMEDYAMEEKPNRKDDGEKYTMYSS